MNREAWLTELGGLIQPIFSKFRVHPYRVTCGWPSKGGYRFGRRRIGECHGPKTSKAGVFELFISPTLDDPLGVAGTMCHELAHVVAGVEAAHGRRFVNICQHVGLVDGKPTSVMPGKRLNDQLRKILLDLPAYPHQAIVPVAKKSNREPTTLKLECPGCGCSARMSRKWIDQSGVPTCGCGFWMTVAGK